MKTLVYITLTLALLSAPAAGRAQSSESRLYTWLFYESWPVPEFGGHGTIRVSWLRYGLPSGAHVELTYNTDTVLIGYRNRQLGSSDLRWSIQLKAEARFTRILSDYFERGLKRDELGFQAHQVELDTRLAWDYAPHQTLELIVTGRRWFFGDLPDTADALALPQLGFHAEPRLSWRYWNLDILDGGTAAATFRPFARTSGVTFGIEAGLELRDDDTPWGALDAAAFTPPDRRNQPESSSFNVQQWLITGLRLSPRWRLQLREAAAYVESADDISRARLGGSGPYFTQLAGHPWAAFLAQTFVAGQLGVRVGVGRDAHADATRHELGLVVDAALVDDIERSGDDALSPTLGVGFLAELRFGRWQLEARAGYAPPLDWQADPPHLTASFGFGTEWLE